MKKENYKPVSLLTTDTKILNNKSNLTAHIKRLYTMKEWNLSHRCWDGSTYAK
jgi:hypothetical protein